MPAQSTTASVPNADCSGGGPRKDAGGGGRHARPVSFRGPAGGGLEFVNTLVGGQPALLLVTQLPLNEPSAALVSPRSAHLHGWMQP